MFSSLVLARLLRYVLALTGTAGTAFAVVTTAGAGAGPPADTPGAVHAPATPGAPSSGPGAPDPGAATTTTTATSPAPGTTATASGTSSGSTSAAPSSTTTAAGSVTTSTTGSRIYIGSVEGGYQQAVAGTGVQLADHAYAFFSGKVPQAEMITVSAASTPWRDVAAAGPGSALYNQIVSWAQTIKSRGGKIMVAYNHEPEGHDRLTLGSAADFINAYRHVETIFDQQGATNVVWTWQMTAYAFRVGPTSPQYAAKWYPGDAYIDNVGADAYNWYTCGANSTGQYNELKQIGDPMIAFARAHGKKASFPEFASTANPQRVTWLNNAHQYFIQNQNILTAAFYFNRPPTVAANSDCKWPLTTSAEFGALRSMAQDTAHFAV